MKTNGSVYVAVVFAALIGYFSYQWWFNPARMVKHRLGEVAAALSVPDDETEVARIARLARLRGYLDDNLHLQRRRRGDHVARRRHGRRRRMEAATAVAATCTSPMCRSSSRPRTRRTPISRWR